MNEKQQNKTIDELINKCPLFKDYNQKIHNVVIPKNHSATLCEIDDIYVYDDFILIGENKTSDNFYSRNKMFKQVRRFKKYQLFIENNLHLKHLHVYYFYAHFENNKIHIEYEGMK